MMIEELKEGRRFYGQHFCIVVLLAALFHLPIVNEVRAQRRGGAKARTGAVKVITGQANSFVYINNVLHGATKEAGELELPRVIAGSYPVLVRTTGFADWKGRVVVPAGGSRELKVALQPTTDEALIHFQKGEALRFKGRNKEAVNEYNQALALRPVFPEARIAATRCLTLMVDYQEAERQIQAAIKEQRSPSAETITVLANLRRNQGLMDEAVTNYLKALRLAKGVSFEAHIGLGITYKELGEMKEAIDHYRTGLVQDMDTEPILYYQFAEILESEKRYKEAIEAYSKYVELDPEGELALAAQSIIKILKEELDRK